LDAPGREIARHFDIEVDLDIEPRYNIAPTQNLPVVREVTGANPTRRRCFSGFRAAGGVSG
jgi:putative SOS response-associated peptidase YedK